MSKNKPAKKPAAKPKNRRFDGFENVLTGLNTTSRDKRRSNQTARTTQLAGQAEENWNSDWLLQRIVEAPVDDMLREGFEVTIAALDGDSTEPVQGTDGQLPEPVAPIGGAAGAQPRRSDADAPVPMLAPPPKPKPGVIEIDDSTTEAAELVEAVADDLHVVDVFAEALKLERGTGGALVLIGAFDGARSLSEPLNVERLEKVTFLTAFSAREARPAAYYNDPKAAKYGQPVVFQVNAPVMPHLYVGGSPAGTIESPESILYIHESRCVFLPGIQTTRYERMRRGGWGQSVVERVFESVADFRSGTQSASALLQDFAQAVLKIKGLAEAFETNAEDVFRARLEAIDMGRSVLRSLVLDAEEDFERKPTPLTGLPETLDRLANVVSAAAEIPVTRLFGQAPAGLNATGAADIRAYYDMLAAQRARKVLRGIEYVLRLVFKSKAGPTNGVEPAAWSVVFPPLWQQSSEERANERKVIADTDVAYINAGVLTPEEVAASRFGGSKFSAETTLDLEGRQLQAAADEDAAEARAKEAQSKPAVPAENEPPETGETEDA